MTRTAAWWLGLSALGAGCLLPEAHIVPDALDSDEPLSGSSSGGNASGKSGDSNSSSGTNHAAGGSGSSSGGDAGSAGSAGSSMAAGGTLGDAGSDSAGVGGSGAQTTFFVSSDTSTTGNLGGLAGADDRCQDLAEAAGIGNHTFRAYLSTSTVNAKDHIGTGPWFNSKGVLVANDLAGLHALEGDPELFIDEKGMTINGQWLGSPAPNEHDILTGSQADGTLMAGMTCLDWTSSSMTDRGQVGHSDGLGPGMSTMSPYNSWNFAHTQDCGNTATTGGAGRIYCFAID